MDDAEDAKSEVEIDRDGCDDVSDRTGGSIGQFDTRRDYGSGAGERVLRYRGSLAFRVARSVKCDGY